MTSRVSIEEAAGQTRRAFCWPPASPRPGEQQQGVSLRLQGRLDAGLEVGPREQLGAPTGTDSDPHSDSSHRAEEKDVDSRIISG